jgi:hypothetical protein
MNTIYVEDLKRDRVFIETYLKYLKLDKEFMVQSVGGYTALFSHTFVNQLERILNREGRITVIFDADTPHNGGGYQARKEYLERKAAENNIPIELFLFPDNEHDGDFETLLEQLIPGKHKGLLSCFEAYEKCVSKKENPLYKTPSLKNKLHTYIYTFEKSKEEEKRFNSQDKDYCFGNPEYWNLDAPVLLPLKAFLERALK